MTNPKLMFPTCQKLSELLVNHLPKLLDKRQQEKKILDLVNLDKTHAKTRRYPSQHQTIINIIAPSD